MASVKEVVNVEPGSWYSRHSIKKGRKAGNEYEDTGVFKFKEIPISAGSLHVSLDLTLNLGDFNSASVGAGVTLPVDVENLENVYKVAKQFVENKISELAKKVQDRKDGTETTMFQNSTLDGWDDLEFIPDPEDYTFKASVTAHYGRRQNMQNFEGAKVTVILTVKSDPETVEDAWKFAEDFVKATVDNEIEQIYPSKGGPQH